MKVTAILFVALISPMLGFTQSEGPKVVSSPFSITITAENATVKSGSTPSIRVRLTNTSNQNLTITSAHFGHGDANYKQDVRDSSGASATTRQATADGGVSGHWTHRILKPGESQDTITDISPEFDLSRPGEYTVQVSRNISENPEDGVVKSNRIVISVTP